MPQRPARNGNHARIDQLARFLANTPAAATLVSALAAGGSASLAKLVTRVAAADLGPKKSKRQSRASSILNTSMDAAPVAIGSSLRTRAPRTTNVGSGSRRGIRVQYRELINGSVGCSSSFAVQSSIPINPGLPASFPWLAPQAQQYEQYRIHSLKFIAVPLNPTSTAGDIIMWMDYNSQDPAIYADIPRGASQEAQALDHEGAVCGSIWEPHVFQAKIADMHALGQKKFVRPCAVAGDIKTFDVGHFYLATNNSAASISCKLFVEYDIEFFVPQLTSGQLLYPVNTSFFYNSAVQNLTKNVLTNLLFGGNPVGFDPLGVYTGYSGGIFLPPAGVYVVTVNLTISNSIVENTSASVAFIVAGTSYPAGTGQEITSESVGNVTFGTRMVIPFTGTNTFSVAVLSTGPTGVLAIPNTTAFITFELA